MSDYSQRFTAFMPFIFKEECDYPGDKSGQFSDDADDPGGQTKWGIDLRGYKDKHPGKSINIRALTYEQAVEIYWQDYWTLPGIESIPYPLGEAACNSFVNGGHPVEWLKQCDGDASRFIELQEQYYKDLCAYWKRKGKPRPYKYLPAWLARTARLRTFLKL